MINNIPEPKISPDFTIEDIHKIREWNYERLKNATPEEYIAETLRRETVAMNWLAGMSGEDCVQKCTENET